MSSIPSLHPRPQKPIYFEEFFEMGQEETVSPFIQPKSRKWGFNLSLKSAIFSAFLLATAFGLSFFPALVPLSLFLLVGVYFFSGIPALIESLEDLASFEVNIDILMTLAAFSSVLIGSPMEGGLLLVLFALSGAMEEAVTSRAKGAISSLHKLSPTKASVIEADGTLVERALREIDVGTTILVKAGQLVPLDGKVIEGSSSVNMVHLTGESLPITKTPGDEVTAGARNLDGALTVHVTHTSADSTLARIIKLVTEAQEARPKLQRWFDAVSERYAMTIIGLALFFGLVQPFVFDIPYFGTGGSIYRALAFLIAASPCALIIAIPIAYLSAVGSCARRGILLKGGITLDGLATCHAAAFDKTGTLTTGTLTCEGVETFSEGADINEALAVACGLERNAVHPIAKAVLSYSQEQGTTRAKLTHFKAVPGYGLQAETEGGLKVAIGNPDFIVDKLEPSRAELLMRRVTEVQSEGKIVALLLVGQQFYLFRFMDMPRPGIKEMIQRLWDHWKMRSVMLTGDHEASARAIADTLGIEEYYANLKPEDKLRYVSKLSQERGLIMLGDGVNDAPALARATVGVCMGKVGSTPAIDAAEVVLLHDNIELLDWLVGKAHKTMAIVRQNLVIATVAIVCASLPALLGLVPLWLAVILHEGGTVIVGLNGLRLLKK